MKKILVGFGAIAFVLVGASMFAAFEAHVVNVTATIENALAVNASAIKFGTVFPQEHLNQKLEVALSGSFQSETRVDDVSYFIRQKPKCGITSNEGKILDETATATGHVSVDTQGVVTIDCGKAPRELQTGESWGVLPSLCEYISKEPDIIDGNDGITPSFHKPFEVVKNDAGEFSIKWLDTDGYLAKSQQDLEDNWTIDLSVPCFGGYCAQDWADFVHGINPNADPSAYTQPIENEHKVFGCDLWVEVSGVSEARVVTN